MESTKLSSIVKLYILINKVNVNKNCVVFHSKIGFLEVSYQLL